MGKTSPIAAEQIEKQKFGDLYDIFNPTEKGKYKFQYLKEEKINGKTYDVIYTFDSQKNWVKFFINKETRLVEIEEKLLQNSYISEVTVVPRIFQGIGECPYAYIRPDYENISILENESKK